MSELEDILSEPVDIIDGFRNANFFMLNNFIVDAGYRKGFWVDAETNQMELLGEVADQLANEQAGIVNETIINRSGKYGCISVVVDFRYRLKNELEPTFKRHPCFISLDSLTMTEKDLHFKILDIFRNEILDYLVELS